MHRIAFDPAANRLSIHVEGFWTPEYVARFAADIGAAVRDALGAKDDFTVLVESLDFPVQANAVADLLQHIAVAGMSRTRGRVAVVVGSQLNKLQAERTLAHPRLRVFRALDEAGAWLAGA